MNTSYPVGSSPDLRGAMEAEGNRLQLWAMLWFAIAVVNFLGITVGGGVAYRFNRLTDKGLIALLVPGILSSLVFSAIGSVLLRNQRQNFEPPEKVGSLTPLRLKAKDLVKKAQAERLAELHKLIEEEGEGAWAHIRTHSHRAISGFDWFMFPTNRRSSRPEFRLNDREIAELKEDHGFMESYRQGVILVARSWGWDATKGCAIENPSSEQHWDSWDVRLGKMLHSLKLFGERELFVNMAAFASSLAPTYQLADWVLKLAES